MSAVQSSVELIGCEDLSPYNRDTCIRYARAFNSPKALLLDPAASRLRKMKSTITTASRLLQDRLVSTGLNASWRPAMITLTYRHVDGWEPSHIRDYLTNCRNWLRRRGHAFHYVWVAELQERGAVHYHIIVWLPKLGYKRFLRLPKPDKSGWWSHGHSNVVWARRPVGYLVKYASKADVSCVFPKGLRLYGVGGMLVSERVELRFWRAPKYVREALGRAADIRKAKGGYYDRFTGLFKPSLWKFVNFVCSRPLFVWVGHSEPFVKEI